MSEDYFSETVKLLVRDEVAAVDPEVPKMVELLTKQGANECWHKHGTFKEHLFHVWRILKIWNQDDAISRCGLYHSAYSNSYVNLAIFHEKEDRGTVAQTIGKAAEELVYLFCRINRHELVFDTLLNGIPKDEDLIVPKEGKTMKHILNGSDMHLSSEVIGNMLIMTMADLADQHYGWQDRLFANDDGKLTYYGNNFTSLWPGDGRPGLWMHCCSRMGRLAQSCVSANSKIVLPPVFNNCTEILSVENERKARDLYWDVVMNKTESDKHDEALKQLEDAIKANPFIAEPHVLAAQILIQKGRFEEGEKHAYEALKLLGQWAAVYDKRISWEGWIAWARVLLLNARKKQWPNRSFGILNLGLVR